MDRNLGATSATPGDVGAFGLFYQWGRKDPFLGSSSISNDVDAKSTITWPSVVSATLSHITITYAVENPTTFIKGYYDWCSDGTDSRWQSDKTIYDPCPSGWRVPDGGVNGVWKKACIESDSDYTSSSVGILFGTNISSPAAWYPAAGLLSDGLLRTVGNQGFYWSVIPNYILYIMKKGYVDPMFDDPYHADGQSVRCQKE